MKDNFKKIKNVILLDDLIRCILIIVSFTIVMLGYELITKGHLF